MFTKFCRWLAKRGTIRHNGHCYDGDPGTGSGTGIGHCY